MQEILVLFLSWEVPWRRDRLPYPLQYCWASLVAQLVKNLPAVQETPVRFLGWEDSSEKVKAAHSSILAWRIPWGCKQLDMAQRLSVSAKQ